VFDAEASEPLIEGIVSKGGKGIIAEKENPSCIRYFRTDDVAAFGTVCTRTTEFADRIPWPH